jgi:hypothetical protein
VKKKKKKEKKKARMFGMKKIKKMVWKNEKVLFVVIFLFE